MATEILAEIVISPGGSAQSIYGEEFDFACLGEVQIWRASFVEPDARGHWWADLSPVRGPMLGPFGKRSAALGEEVRWLRLHLLKGEPDASGDCGDCFVPADLRCQLPGSVPSLGKKCGRGGTLKPIRR